ncbi:hypothetical protein DW228_06260 [Bacteroides fragilis]|uniref:YubB ferredoxin-like domain-containing protein n=1 Tax=Bacteroides fragilis TaxID=817 RepID=A0A396C7Z4_BACFG|nr:hypothetical protein [Bacteroides fragilis]RHH14400.1 hypothetical protein DW228_06260 [Bacteroides fragilis]
MNWCNTSYTIEGNQAEITDLMDKMESLSKYSTSLLPNDFGKNWLGNLLHLFGGNPKKINCRGRFLNLFYAGDNIIQFDTETGNEELYEVWAYILQSYPSCKCYFYSEECSCQRYVTNDKEGRFYPNRFRLEYEIDDIHLVENEHEILTQVAAILGKEVSNWHEMEEAVRNYNEYQNEESTIRVNKISVI